MREIFPAVLSVLFLGVGTSAAEWRPKYWISAGVSKFDLDTAEEFDASDFAATREVLPTDGAVPQFSFGIKFYNRYGVEAFYSLPYNRRNTEVVGANYIEGTFESLGLSVLYFMGGIHGIELFAGARATNWRYTAATDTNTFYAAKAEAGFGYGFAIGAEYAMPYGLGLRAEYFADRLGGEFVRSASGFDARLYWTF